MDTLDLDCLRIDRLRSAYVRGVLTPMDVAEYITSRLAVEDENNVWISTVSAERLHRRARELTDVSPRAVESLPLYGVPFAVKDNIDCKGLSTTAACEGYRYEPTDDATVVERLREAGAILIGKTNMDQFATGLVGTRSPYGVCQNAFDPTYISGGSSAGSGVAVAQGVVSFALGTDTGGSGRVPAALNNVVGLKPTRGVLSTEGVVPACRTLDCISIFALTCRDALIVERIAAGYDPEDAYSRRMADNLELAPIQISEEFSFGIPDRENLEFFGDNEAVVCFETVVNQLESIGGTKIEVNFDPFRNTAELLYDGPWVAERFAAISELLESDPDALLSITHEIIKQGAEYSAIDTFEAMYELNKLKRSAKAALEQVDVLITPTTGTVYTIEEIRTNPIELNSNLGYYTSFTNLMDMSAIAIPGNFRNSGLPFGVTLFGDARLKRPTLRPLGHISVGNLAFRSGRLVQSE